MCTASWLIRPGGYELFFNRDESRRRALASGPRITEAGAFRAIVPRDGDGGGTWIGVNARGLGLGLLNAWHLAAGESGSYRSRGLLVLDLLATQDLDGVRTALEEESLERYRGFTLAVFSPGVEPTLFAWDGQDLREDTARAPLSSSSYDASGAASARSALYPVTSGADGDREALLGFHRSHEPERGPFSPCMHRDDACTVSSSHLTVTTEEIRFAYAAGAPCEAPFGEPVVLRRESPRSSVRDLAH